MYVIKRRMHDNVVVTIFGDVILMVLLIMTVK